MKALEPKLTAEETEDMYNAAELEFQSRLQKGINETQRSWMNVKDAVRFK